ncbi:protein ROOT PRIMORDIUM DEFECTIVE 1 [Amborella trichopoda]|uniref:PORR domain-containing protein n=1 Tax=Amborella trichopoda TaxID=13333 RepID=U5CVS8_AMBTC|nr:protein ROOT PRIMORDIUM DEFECTIVE 1 [Amborella trichopoda]ERN14229.1 hypothetical protein AMTR_s00033p00133210 [Amborella trichopoda]|eukprot:XP_006852762.1 protein ROOT PRIMORDIUM DEFECTIVE 1 [Amborella trichopoda]
MMMVSLSQLLPNNTSQISFSKRSCSLLSNKTSFVPSSFHLLKQHTTTCKSTPKPNPPISLALKPIPYRPLDNLVKKKNKLRFITKLKTLLLSKPQHFLSLHTLSKCLPYLGIPRRRLLLMIRRYPSIFHLFHNPDSSHSLSVTLTPAAFELYAQESSLKAQIEGQLVLKLRKLLMLSQHRRLLLSKLVHLGPDLGLPIDFRSKLCQKYPQYFKVIDTSYGLALELVSWDPILATPIPQKRRARDDLIIDRPPKFKQLWLQKGLNLKRKHRDYLFKFEEMNQVSPYSDAKEFKPFTMEAEKRACGVVREVLGLTMEKRTLVDHLTHFRKDFGLPNRLRAMLVRHPEMFYVSLKGLRDSVFLTEAYERRELLDKDELLGAKERLMELVREGKRMKREKLYGGGDGDGEDDEADYGDSDDVDDDDDGFGFRDLWESGIGEDWQEVIEEEEENVYEIGEFWSVKKLEGGGSVDNPW